jgi:predicted  nucleic acid-binding Zn-ribbon protein
MNRISDEKFDQLKMNIIKVEKDLTKVEKDLIKVEEEVRETKSKLLDYESRIVSTQDPSKINFYEKYLLGLQKSEVFLHENKVGLRTNKVGLQKRLDTMQAELVKGLMIHLSYACSHSFRPEMFVV